MADRLSIATIEDDAAASLGGLFRFCDPRSRRVGFFYFN